MNLFSGKLDKTFLKTNWYAFQRMVIQLRNSRAHSKGLGKILPYSEVALSST